jgi:endo-1,4-beta-mannosidase
VCSTVPEAADRFRLGVNYWPASVAMDWLSRYDPVRTRDDFRLIGGADLDTVRIFVRWDEAQPTPTRIDPRVLHHLVDAADAAHEAGVELIVTLFTGHMSGVNYIPAWATSPSGGGDRRFRVVSRGLVQPHGTGLRNWYGDPEMVEAASRMATAAASALAGHPAVWAWDLGNESSNCTVPPDGGSAHSWMERMTDALRAADPGRPVTVGIHMEDIEEDRLIGPAEAARWCDFVCMHGYPIYADFSTGPTDDQLVPFLALVAAWLAGDAPVLFEELGLPTLPTQTAGDGQHPMLVDESAAASYTARVLDNLWNVGCIGALVWCFTDYDTALHDQAPFDEAVHERTFGLWRTDGSPKLAVAEIEAQRGRTRRSVPSDRPWLDIDVAEFATDRRMHLARLYSRYRSLVAPRM